MPDYFETDPVGSERLLGKVMTGGSKIKRRRQMIGRGVVAGFVGVVAVGGAIGASQFGHRGQVPTTHVTSTIGVNRPKTVRLVPVQTRASSFVPGHGPGNVDDGNSKTFWATNKTIPVRVHNKIEMSAPGVGSWIRLIYAKPETIRTVAILTGDRSPTSLSFSKAERPSEVELIFSSGPPVFVTLLNIPELHEISVAPRRSSFVEVKILTVDRLGTSIPFCAIAEVASYSGHGVSGGY